MLLVPSEPTTEWKRLVLRFTANDRVTYLKGDLRSINDLQRVSTQTASSCFILCNRCVSRASLDPHPALLTPLSRSSRETLTLPRGPRLPTTPVVPVRLH